MVAEICTGVGEKMPTPDGPVCIAPAGPEELVTAADGAVVSVDKSVVVVEDEPVLVDGPEVLVFDTASCARNVDDHADRRSVADKRADSLLISRINRSGSSLGGSKKRAPTNNQYPIGGSFRSIEIPSSAGACKDRDRAERATGIEPAWPAWKAGTLPLRYAGADSAQPARTKLAWAIRPA